MAVVVLLAVVAGGCGSASSTSTKTSQTAPKPASSRPAATANAPDAVAVVVGTPITHAVFNHWMYVAAKGQASQTPGAPVIVPDPPDYKGCLAKVRKTLPQFKAKSTKTLVADCHQLFVSLSSQVMDFLIKADWMQADAARHGIVVTDAQVERAYNNAKKQQFPGGKGYQAFLAKTGQTDQDVRFRFRINQIFSQLTAREKGSTDARQSAVSKREQQQYKAHTTCTPLVRMNDCANYRAG